MSLDLNSLQTEIQNYSQALQAYLDAEATYASDSTQPVPEFPTSITYDNLLSAAYVNSGNQATLILGEIIDQIYKMFAAKRELLATQMTKADYYSQAAIEFSDDVTFERVSLIEALKYLKGATPYQGGLSV